MLYWFVGHQTRFTAVFTALVKNVIGRDKPRFTFGYYLRYLIMVHSTLGLFHVASALLAMLSGAVVILKAKGGLFHRRIGYVYVTSMLMLNLSAFQIYHLFGRFGPFHALAIVSLLCLVGGMLPALFRQRVKLWMYWHYYFMNWSVVGLYAAFWAELFTRTLPIKQFWPIVLVASSITSWIGSYFIRKHAPRLLALRE